MARSGSGASGDRRAPPRGADSWNDRQDIGIGYLIGVLGGAVAVAALVALALTFDWVDTLRNVWRNWDGRGTASRLAAEGDEKVTDLGSVITNIGNAVSGQGRSSESRLQDTNRALGDAAGARPPAARR